jgi:hypothetical protein
MDRNDGWPESRSQARNGDEPVTDAALNVAHRKYDNQRVPAQAMTA